MEHRYSVLRKHLDELGYKESLIIESVPLAERLLADLVKTTESLYHYKNVAQSALEERDQLQLGAEPYKCDNAKLVKECNDLHLAFLQYREQTDKAQRDLKVTIHTLERENQDLSEKQRKTGEKSSKTNVTRRTIPSKTSLTKVSATSVDTAKSVKSDTKSDKSKDKHKCANMSGTTAVAEYSFSCLKEEVKKLRVQLLKQNEFSECLKEKLNNRELEIHRLNALLEGGRPLNALNKDCCYKEMSVKLRKLTEDNIILGDAKKNQEKQLADAIAKQHEAMKRALYLADRNKELERELRDLDQMALAVEEECNSAVKKNFRKVSDELQTCHFKIGDLEKELRELKRQKNHIDLEFETVKQEKDNLHTILENTLDDKKKMTDRINQFTRIEHDLNLEIDRLMQTCTLQKRKIADLEYQLTKKSETRLQNLHDNREDEEIETDMERRRSTFTGSPRNSCYKNPRCKKKGSINDKGDLDNSLFEKLRGERDYYQQECQRLCDELNNRPVELSTSPESMKRNLREKQDQVARLEHDIQELTRDKHALLNKLESALEVDKWSKDMDSATLKSVVNRVEKERDLARGDVKRLEEERDSLRKRLKCATETHVSERDRLQKLMSDSEEKLRQLEIERREMMTVQGSRRATINNMEDQIESYKSQIRTTQSELEHIHTLYGQIKTLQEQTDRALADTQGQLTQVEMEYTHAQERIRELEKDRAEQDKELSLVKNDICVLKGNLAKVDCQRDKLLIELDNKTERIAVIEQEFVSKDNKLITLETTITELRKQLSLYTDEAATNEYKLKNNCHELCALKKELEDAVKSKNLALTENRRLQNDLTKASCDCRNKSTDLDRASREIDDLKTQLQQYVYEVKRAEDLISKKENERADMLDQYRTLSQEANLLETSNHTLENGTMELKSQLTATKDHINDLENKVEQMAILNKDYELQISQLTCQIACLETQIKQHASANSKTEVDLQAMRELVCKLDGQKDKLVKDMKEKDDYRSHLEREKDRLKGDINKLQDSLHKEQTNLGSLENLLSESRQETVEQRLLNQELQTDIGRLKTMVEELQAKLSACCSSGSHSIHTINTVDVRLHTDPSPRSISSIFTNIMQKKPQESIVASAPVYEVCYNTDVTPRKKDNKEDNDTYRSHTKYKVGTTTLDTSVHVKRPEKTYSSITNTTDFTKTTNSYNYLGRNGGNVINTERMSPVHSRRTSPRCSCLKNKHI